MDCFLRFVVWEQIIFLFIIAKNGPSVNAWNIETETFRRVTKTEPNIHSKTHGAFFGYSFVCQSKSPPIPAEVR